MNTQLRLKPVICRRKRDNSLWTPAGDCPYPFSGFTFVRVIGKKRRWWHSRWLLTSLFAPWRLWVKVDMDDRWVFYDGSEFNVVEGGAVPPVRMPPEQP